MADFEQRKLPPQSPQGQDIFFAQTTGHGENQKKYVFVDEHNRHKRLKVIRACEGCRRRKIKCDSATTNQWPCAACVRLKLDCVPPAMNFDKSLSASEFGDASDSSDFGTTIGQHDGPGFTSTSHTMDEAGGMGGYGKALFPDSHTMQPMDHNFQFNQRFDHQQQYDITGSSFVNNMGFPYQAADGHRSPLRSQTSDAGLRSESSAEDLNEHLGELQICESGAAPYIANQSKSLAETPAIQEQEIQLPAYLGSDGMVRIPPEMMPSDQKAMEYFEYFFTNIHPYVPVLSRTYFFQQWHLNRNTISPLILEAIFACSSRLLNNEAEGNRWLALSSKHEESFKDVPRLSTIQAMLLVLKAREAIPKRGYYYRSWMTLVNLIAMAKDLEFDQHYELHQMGKSCGSTVYDCVAKSRIWHTLYIEELMIGAPQGRSDFAIHLNTVNFDIPTAAQGLDDAELRISQQHTYFMRTIKNLRLSSSLCHQGLRKQKDDWALDPVYVSHNADFDFWIQDLPRYFQISYPSNGSPPYIPSHFAANVHSYHQLSVLLHHRPQLQATSSSIDGVWMQHMNICYSAAKKICLLQEAVLQSFGLPGLLFMLRGINCAIYTIMTCTMLHLVALTSPDVKLNADATDYFTRHMRILEQCIELWPMPELKMQIDSLRHAFSADINKPFELTPSFPYGTPGSASKGSPSSDTPHSVPASVDGNTIDHASQAFLRNMAPEPTLSLDERGLKVDVSGVSHYNFLSGGNNHHITQHIQMSEDTVQWNPSKIFDQCNTAFFTPPSSASAKTPPNQGIPVSGSQDLRQFTSSPYRSFTPPDPNASPQPSQPVYRATHVHTQPNLTLAENYVTPSMWQDAVAGTYGEGLKRQRNDNTGSLSIKRSR